MKNVDDDLEVIEHHPLTGGEAVDGGGPYAMFLLELRLNLTRDRFQMRLGCSRANNKEIGEAGNLAQI